jgi:2-oxoisovalerate dehydrogenase E1 component
MNMTKKKNTDLEKKAKINELKLTKNDLEKFLYNIFLSRKIDDTEIAMKKQGTAFFQISGAGHEGILSALATQLRPSYDYVIGYYRDRALCTGLGVTAYEMLCQANGNIGDSASHGRQMPAHWGNKRLNIVNKSSCTGTQFLQAVGLAETGLYLQQLQNAGEQLPELSFHNDEIVVVSSGDGTTSQGEFWEALTTACVNKLPVLFLIEDNGYAISVPVSVQTPGGSISQCLANFPGLKILETDGNCPVESYEASVKAVDYLRKRKGGPVLLHAHVTRPYSHSLSDSHDMYRTQEDLEDEKRRDVFNSFPAFLVRSQLMTAAEIEAISKKVADEVNAAKKKALETPWPEISTAMDHIFSHDILPTDKTRFETTPQFQGKDDVPMAGAINAVLRSEVRRNPLIRVFGEDVADFSDLEKFDTDLKGKGGVFKVTSGVQRVGKKNQVFNSPLAEANIIGRAIGMAMRGLKPVVEIQFFDYIWTAYMQLKNEMATTRYRSGGDFKCPMVVRVPIGGYLKGGAMYHSQCGESLFTHIPGIYVAYPSNALDAAGLLRTAIRSDDPVMFLEHKHLYYQGYNRTADPGEEFMIPFGKGRVVRTGSQLTIVTWGALVQRSVEAAKKLEEMGYSVEIIDPRTLVPFDLELVMASLKKTNRLLIVHEETKTSGFAGEIAMLINEHAFESLDAPIKRLTTPDSHIAYCPQLEDHLLPQIQNVIDASLALLKY